MEINDPFMNHIAALILIDAYHLHQSLQNLAYKNYHNSLFYYIKFSNVMICSYHFSKEFCRLPKY